MGPHSNNSQSKSQEFVREDIFQYLLNNITRYEDFTSVTEKFISSNQNQYAIRICEKLHQVIDSLYNEQSKIKSLLEKDKEIVAEIKKKNKDATEDELELVNQITKNQEFYDSLPKTLTEYFTPLQKKISDASKLMVKAALQIYNSGTNNKPAHPNAMEVDNDDDNKEEELYKELTATVENALNPIMLPHLALESISNENLFGSLTVKICQLITVKLNQQRAREIELVRKSPLNLDNISYQIFQKAVTTIFQSLSQLETKAKNNIQLNSRELKELAILQSGELLKEFIEYMLPEYLSDPDGMIKAGNELVSRGQYNHVILITERARVRLEAIRKDKDARSKILKRISDLKTDIASIKKVGGNPLAQQEELTKLEETTKVYSVLPSYSDINNTQYSNYILQIGKLRIQSILEMKEKSKNNTTMNIDQQFEETLNTILDPDHIFELAQLLQSKKEYDTAVKYGERCQKFISDLEKLRQIRLPLQQQLDALLNEEKTLRSTGKVLTKAKLDQMVSLQEQIASLPEWPSFGKLNDRYQYDDLNFNIVQLMISCVLEKKKKLEESKEPNNNNNAQQKEIINLQVDTLVKLCLEKFQDPVYLLKFANHIKSNHEDKVLLNVITQIFNRCNEIDSQRKERNSLLSQINDINESIKRSNPQQQKELGDKKQKLEDTVEKLPVWPHYAQLGKDNQYDSIRLQASNVLMNSLLDTFSFVEEKIRKQKLFALKNVDEKELLADKKRINKSIQDSLLLCLSNIEEPSSITSFANDLGDKRDTLFLEISNFFHPKIKQNYKKSVDYSNDKILVDLLSEELQELTKMKKDMSDEDLQLLDETKQKVSSQKLPYVTEYLKASQYHSSMIVKGLDFVYKSKSSLYSRISLGELKQEESDELIKQSKENIQTIFNYISEYIEDPETFKTLMSKLLEKKEYERVSELGVLAFKKLDQFRSIQAAREILQKEKAQLLEEKEQLDRQRRRLPADKLKQLRDIKLKERYNDLLPKYYTTDLDQLSLTYGNSLITAASQEKSEFEESVTRMSESQLRAVSAQRKQYIQKISETVKSVVDHIQNLETLLSFSKNLFSKKEYSLVLQVGNIIESLLEEKKALIDRKEELEKEAKDLQQQFLHSQDPKQREKKIQPKIDKNEKELSEIVLTHSYEDIKRLTLEITKLMIDAANFEDLGEVIRDQMILSFKYDTTPEKWDQIRNLSSEEEWFTTKQELVGFVMKREEGINAKIELLMKDGLFEQCIQIFPHPALEEEELNIQLNLLASLYDAMEQFAPLQLQTVMPIVQKYAKRCYQEWKPEKLDTLFDSVQKTFPLIIKDIFEKALDMLLVNILQSQYPILLSMLKNFKKRMVATLGMTSVWEDFLEKFKKQHKGKKRLIQMVSFIGDSVWNIEQANPASTTGTKRSKASQSSSSQPLKKIKVSAPTSSPVFATPATKSTPTKTPAKKPITKKRKDDDEEEEEEEEEQPSTPVMEDVTDEEKDDENDQNNMEEDDE
eukprot:gene7695-9465_t